METILALLDALSRDLARANVGLEKIELLFWVVPFGGPIARGEAMNLWSNSSQDEKDDTNGESERGPHLVLGSLRMGTDLKCVLCLPLSFSYHRGWASRRRMCSTTAQSSKRKKVLKDTKISNIMMTLFQGNEGDEVMQIEMSRRKVGQLIDSGLPTKWKDLINDQANQYLIGLNNRKSKVELFLEMMETEASSEVNITFGKARVLSYQKQNNLQKLSWDVGSGILTGHMTLAIRCSENSVEFIALVMTGTHESYGVLTSRRDES
ncbi:hypothetical protein FXO38_26803 [Capsicum annuum]|nr:hypothetical protein FXO37_31268 [Capsicum annuum]KAF3631080.1 hypothetical protein FXO38_26803 [Capsicum annuum]